MNALRSRINASPARRLLVLFGAISGSIAFAAPAPAGTDEPTASSLSPAETLTQARVLQTSMQDDLRLVTQLQDVAKKQKDVIKLNCVNDKLTQMKGHLAVADQATASLNEAIAKSDDGGRQQEYTRLSILHQKALLLATEAKNCVGEDLSYVGATSVVEVIDPSVPQKDATAFSVPALEEARPPAASAAF